jgi:hypothetical protein
LDLCGSGAAARSVFEVNATKLEVQHFADTRAGDAKQADEATEHPGP